VAQLNRSAQAPWRQRKKGGRRLPGPAPLALGLFLLLTAATGTPVAAKADASPPVGTLSAPLPVSLASQADNIQIVMDAAYFDTMINLIRNSGQRIDLAMFLFKTGTARNNRPTQVVRELVQARQRGVLVRVILDLSGHDEKINTANRETARVLEKGGVTVLFDSPARTQHGKLLVVDGRHCLVGSHNLTQAALKHNHELSLLLDSPHLAARLLAYMDTLVLNP